MGNQSSKGDVRFYGHGDVRSDNSFKGRNHVKNSSSLNIDMPDISDEQLDQMFQKLLEEMDLSEDNRNKLLEFDRKRKWILIQANQANHERKTSEEDSVDSLLGHLQQINNSNNEDDKIAALDKLAVALRTLSMRWVISFIEYDGFSFLLHLLNSMTKYEKNGSVHSHIIKCIKALMNNNCGLEIVIQHPEGINTISKSLVTTNCRTRTLVFEILGAVCLIPDGHRQVLEGIRHLQASYSLPFRFWTIIESLVWESTSSDEITLKTSAMAFVNALICSG
eukprot:Sdes_comp17403_c0_seq1m6617